MTTIARTQDAAPSYIPCSASVSPIEENATKLFNGLRNQTGPYEEVNEAIHHRVIRRAWLRGREESREGRSYVHEPIVVDLLALWDELIACGEARLGAK
ncbi:MAG TPA: hypothetical protein VGR77_06035 [Candidatus Dormibacteraeota bacterium]|nr:hypothetical protein [Candidatus Dormibacteraeota bacterium]